MMLQKRIDRPVFFNDLQLVKGFTDVENNSLSNGKDLVSTTRELQLTDSEEA